MVSVGKCTWRRGLPSVVGAVLILGCHPAEAGGWSGAYAGFSAGYASGDDQAQEINGARNYIADFNGAVGSAHIGWQQQYRSIVAGIEVEAGYLSLSDNVTREVVGGSITSGADLGAYAAFTGRLGYLIDPATLVYGRAGVAVAKLDSRTTQTCTGPDLCGGAQSSAESSAATSDYSLALVIGGGLERAIDARWTARIDYQFMNFRDELALPAVDGPGWEHEADVHTIQAGLSYRF